MPTGRPDEVISNFLPSVGPPSLAPEDGGFSVLENGGALLAVAVHDGHHLRADVAALTALEDIERLREEDPGTGAWTRVAPSRVVVGTSRFEVDLNRPPERAVYRVPADAWGLDVWDHTPGDDVVARSLERYHAFYAAMEGVLDRMLDRSPSVVVYDLHTYNHLRDGPEGPPADESGNPEINVGTGSMDRERWAPVVDAFIHAMGGADYRGRSLDVRENVRFRGGHLSGWLHDRYPGRVCALAVEVKKIFMDEWTGEVDPDRHSAIGACLAGTIDPVLSALNAIR